MVIVFKSHTGHTEQYAKLLGKQLNMEVYDIADINEIKGQEAIFFGWVCVGKIQGLNKAERNLKVKAIVAVGISDDTQTTILNLAKQNRIEDRELFFLQGGVDLDMLKGFKKWIITMVLKGQAKEEIKLNKLADRKPERDWDAILEKGFSMVDKENLNVITKWHKQLAGKK